MLAWQRTGMEQLEVKRVWIPTLGEPTERSVLFMAGIMWTIPSGCTVEIVRGHVRLLGPDGEPRAMLVCT